MTAVRPQTKSDILMLLTNHPTTPSLTDDELEALYNRLRDRGVIKYATVLGVYLSRDLTAEDLDLSSPTGAA